MKYSYLGPDGSYSSVAAKALFEGRAWQGMPCDSFYAAVRAVEDGAADAAVLPVENTLQGAVTQTLDLLYAAPELYAVREYVLRIEHRLIAKGGTTLQQVRRVFSHEQALLQCGKFLSEHLPHAQLVRTESTAQSLSCIQSAGDAGIVGAHVRMDGMSFIGENIADEAKNFTRFVVAEKGKEHLPAHSERVYFAASCRHEPGSLLKLLQILSVYDRNMTRIGSRPIKNAPGEYCFFIEFEGDIADPDVRAALDRVAACSRGFKLLGCY